MFSKHNKGRANVSYAVIKGKLWEAGGCCRAAKEEKLTISSEITASVYKHMIAQSYVPTTTSISAAGTYLAPREKARRGRLDRASGSRISRIGQLSGSHDLS